MGANYALDGDERIFVKRLLTELYPNTSFSMVSDTYDYWNMVENIIPSLKEEILAHNGKLFIRPDSGDQYETVVKTVLSLWDTFGGHLNSKGYKVLNPHIGVILGDGCTQNVVKKIYKELDRLGFAANNVIFGVGAFCFTAIFEGDRMIVNTRDTWGVAMKATYGQFGEPDGKELMIYKDPKTDTDNLKKSHKGLVFVERDGDNFKYTDGLLYMDYMKYKHSPEHKSALRPVFADGKMYNRESFTTIRERLANEK
jgi:nicotinamide phosphoribosyltransferase